MTSFPTTYSGCTVMPVSLTVTGGDIVNLNGLSVLTSFENTASLTIEANPALTSLSGLAAVTSVGGSIKVIDNDALTNLNGLSGVTSIGFNLQVDGNATLTSLGPLSGVTTIGGYLDVEFNPALTSFGGGLNNLTSVGQFLQINNNGALSTLNGLNSLASVGQYVFISSNNALTSVNGLSSLSSVGGDCELSGLPSMTSLIGLTNLATIGGTLSVIQTGLTNINEFENITNIGGNLSINFNSALSDCDAQGICDYVDVPNGTIAINDNLGACLNLVAVQTACGLLPVELLEFNAVIRDNSVKLAWSTASEKDNMGYDLERSAEGNNWSAIGFIPGKGTSNHRMDYFFEDKKPITGVNYYRLKQMDDNGKFEYSPIVVVDTDRGGDQPFDVFPNPSNSGLITVKVASQEEGDANLEVYDQTGIRVFYKNIQLQEGTIVFPLSFSSFPQGAYSVRVKMPDGQVLLRKLLIH
ncbi:MAG: T9SS type A sorting domain-containing protein [Lewinellaceae bacterium]|nr:T9SS type A sorting domain-containing protein [Lewinellaceae bacterium]